MATRRELADVIGQRYVSARRGEKIKILDEFVALTGHHPSMRCDCCGALRRRRNKGRGPDGVCMAWRFARRS